jgi:hypothetical protein
LFCESAFKQGKNLAYALARIGLPSDGQL